jgi:alkylation response protein AidB-like acyl-CoA dehydrogenase
MQGMSNFFTDNRDLMGWFDRLDLEEVVDVLENGYSDDGDLAPSSYDEARDGYRTALEMVGEISAAIAPHSQEIDRDGASLVDGVVRYAPASLDAYRRLAEAGFAGTLVPRRYGGLNFPASIYLMMIEMVSRADASLMTMFGYQDVGEAIAEFADEETARALLPGYCAGDVIGAMVLTEPGGGSDLQAVRTRAHQDADGIWRLNGTKQFISNGNGGMLLVLARSEADSPGMFGLSLFASDGTGVRVTRVEEKMGLHGSPTCELVFEDAPVRLVGKRRMGLVLTMHTLNHARFSVAAQALGIADAAYRDARAWARERMAFGKPIEEIPQVANMLVDMQVTLEACRALLYDGGWWLDLRNKREVALERLRDAGADTVGAKSRFKVASSYVDLLSPAVKYLVTERCQQVCLDAQQLFGGMGYIREVPAEQRVRDIRITTIYEGTSQVQAGAALTGVMSDTLRPLLEWRAGDESGDGVVEQRIQELDKIVSALRDEASVLGSIERDAAARDLVDAYIGLYAAHLLYRTAPADDRVRRVTERWVTGVLANAKAACERLRMGFYGHGSHLDVISP